MTNTNQNAINAILDALESSLTRGRDELSTRSELSSVTIPTTPEAEAAPGMWTELPNGRKIKGFAIPTEAKS